MRKAMCFITKTYRFSIHTI